LKNNNISEKTGTENTGAEKSKLFPTDIGMVVNDFLMENFEQIMDFNFTASVEKEFDDIAEGEKEWIKMIDKFYKPFHGQVENVLKNSERSKGERILGEDPKSGKVVSVKIGRYGPLAQLGEASEESGEKPQFASLRAGQRLETITLEEALDLFKLPRDLGNYENKKVTVSIGRFGPYIRHDSSFVSLGKEDDPFSVGLERAIHLIEAKREKDKNAVIKTFEEEPDLKVLKGRWGPYISYQKKNYKIPKKINAENLSLEECKKIMEESPEPKTKKHQERNNLRPPLKLNYLTFTKTAIA
jgi:DNA topoisomerase I